MGVDYSVIEGKDNAPETIPQKLEVTEIEQESKVNIGRRKNAYNNENQKGSLQNTFFNEELGIMMEKMVEGCTRNDYWEILRN